MSETQFHAQTLQSAFEDLVRAVIPADTNRVTLGNVDFWIDASGPWAGQLSYSLPREQWQLEQVRADLSRLVLEGLF